MTAPVYDSNTMPFEVLEAETRTSTGIEILLYRPENPAEVVEVLGNRFAPTALEQLNDDGGGGFKIHAHDPKIDPAQGGDPTLLNYGNIFRVLVDGKVVQCCEITGRKLTLVSEGEEAGLVWEITGIGYGANTMRNAVVYPELGLKKASLDTRYFSFAAKTGTWYHPIDWVEPAQVVQQSDNDPSSPWSGSPYPWPLEWPEALEEAWWLWDRVQTKPDGSAPVGDVYFRAEFTITQPHVTLTLIMTVDDLAWAFVDGQQILSIESVLSWQKTFQATVDVDAGTHVFGIRARNLRSRAGVLFGLSYQVTSDDAPTWLIKSGVSGGVKMFAYPSPAPGWTAAEVLRNLLTEAQARNVQGADNLSLGFTDTTDTSGNTWATPLDWSFGVGTKYREVLEQISANSNDWTFDPVTLQLKMWPLRGVDRTVQAEQEPVYLRPALNVTSAEMEGTAEIANWLLVKSTDGWSEVSDSGTSISSYGRREDFLSSGSTVDASASAQAAAQLVSSAKPDETLTIAIVAVEGATPWFDFGVGDWVFAADADGSMSKRRVMSIAVEEDEDTGQPLYTIELDSIKKSDEERMARWLMAVGGGTMGGTATSSMVKGNGGLPASQIASSGPVGATGQTGAQGPAGTRLIAGVGAPSAGTGNDGDWYLDVGVWDLWGPKAAGAWPGTAAVNLKGADGATILSGTRDPLASDGRDGDYWINETALTWWGPKTSGAWPGTANAELRGTDGTTILSGARDPLSSDGKDGDYWSNTAAHTFWGPKAAGAWPGAGLDLVGPRGEIGPDGPAGAGNGNMNYIGDWDDATVYQVDDIVGYAGDTFLRLEYTGVTEPSFDFSKFKKIAFSPDRMTSSVTTASLAPLASEQTTIQLARGYKLYAVQVSSLARVRVYATAAQQAGDLSRAFGTDPTGNHGVMLDYQIMNAPMQRSLSPMVDGMSLETVPSESIPITITNTGSVPATITATLTWIRTE